MTDSRRTTAALVVRILACLITAWGILLLIDSNRPENDVAGYFLLVAGPLVMLAARWVTPASMSSSKETDGSEDGERAVSKAADTAPSGAAGEDPR